MPGYGVPPEPEGMLPWAWARERLERTRNYWIGTVGSDGSPHSMPVWGVWLDEALHFSTGVESKKARNLRRNPHCAVTTESADEAVIVEGTASPMSLDLQERVLSAYATKYDWAGDPGGWFTVTPRKAFGFIENESQFASAATRWSWD
jgi:nitroimidazol reductase NimA-like FMN-containing flavoprotein (pyridoxamine 5'-phosphate oxidase superfamily)